MQTFLNGEDLVDLREMGRRVELEGITMRREGRSYVRVRILRKGFRPTHAWAEAPELDGGTMAADAG